MAPRSALLTVMVAAAEKAARALKRDFGEIENLQVSRKGPADFVSAADLKAEKTLVAELSKARPGFGFLLEEGGAIQGNDTEHRWIIDPVDGTTNFLHGIPHVAISIGLERAGQLIAGVVMNPITDETYVAEKGGGAYMNNRRLRVAVRVKLDDALIATGIPFRGRGTPEEHEVFLGQQRRIMAATAGIRRMGTASLDLAFVASGRYDGFWETSLKPWDIAAGILLVREAGGTVTDPFSAVDPMVAGHVLASNTALQEPLRTLIRG
ncbi:MAG: inositol monophosphatase [Alphaproteobacteria bacterium]|nr:inositol monophosphatase [Alphaproteobacteria bacterium]